MSFFKEVEGDAAILIENGVFRQVALYTRDGYLYAKVSGGFVRLMADGATSKAKCRLDFMSYDGKLCRDALNRLCTVGATGSNVRPLEQEKILRLLGPSS